MSILLISNYKESVGGISVQVKLLQDHLRADGIDVDIFSTKGSAFTRISAFFKLLKIGRAYDIFHIHACSNRGFLPAIIGIIAGKILKKRIVLTYHGGDAESYISKNTRFVRFFLSRTDANIVASKYLGTVFERYNIAYTNIPNIIELDRSRFRIRERISPKFICIRSHTNTYNLYCTIKAFSAVKKQINDATLTLLGDGPLHKELMDYVTDNSIDGISFIGQVDNKKIYGFLDNADIMLSSPIIDNMPVSILEGFNAGLLVISSNVGGVPYMIEDGVSGLLFESNNSQQMAEKMLWALNEQQKVHEIIKRARITLDDYTWESVRNKLTKVYGN